MQSGCSSTSSLTSCSGDGPRSSSIVEDQLMMVRLISINYIRVPSIIRRIRAMSTTIFPLAWLSCLLGCMFATLSQRSQPDFPRLRLDGLYQSHATLLPLLGFVPDPVLYPHAHHQDQDLPVFVIAVGSDDLHSFHRFLGSFRLHFNQKRLLVYDLGLTPEERSLVRGTCQCLVRDVHWTDYPEHVRDLTLKAYRPLLIQETLQEFGLVFWCHHTMRFNSSEALPALRAKAESLGLVAWPAQNFPTSTYTHYATFRYLSADPARYHFHRMAEPDSALYCNTYRLHHKLMLPWVVCALDVACIAPQGARAAPCNLAQRPRYLYAGCHRYDASAFNVLLGDMFYLDNDYVAATPAIFQRELRVPARVRLSDARFGRGNYSSRWNARDNARKRTRSKVIKTE